MPNPLKKQESSVKGLPIHISALKIGILWHGCESIYGFKHSFTAWSKDDTLIGV